MSHFKDSGIVERYFSYTLNVYTELSVLSRTELKFLRGTYPAKHPAYSNSPIRTESWVDVLEALNVDQVANDGIARLLGRFFRFHLCFQARNAA